MNEIEEIRVGADRGGYFLGVWWKMENYRGLLQEISCIYENNKHGCYKQLNDSKTL